MAAVTEARKRPGASSMDSDQVDLIEEDGNVRSSPPDSDTSDEESGTILIPNEKQSKGKKTVSSLRKRLCTARYKKISMIVFVTLLGLILILMVSIPLGIWNDLPRRFCSDLTDADEFAPYVFDPATGSFALCHNQEPLVTATFGEGHQYITEKKVDHFNYTMNSVLYLSRHDVSTEHCVRIEWTGSTTIETPLTDCFAMDEGIEWFGGYESFNQVWPINGEVRQMTPFLPRDYTFDNTSQDAFGPILHPIWLTSNGVAIFVDEDVPLQVSINESKSNQICFRSLPYSLNCLPGASVESVLRYTVCGFKNISMASQFFLQESGSFDPPQTNPAWSVFLNPIWSTWAVFKENITQDKVIEFATNITSRYGYPISQFEIDDGYTDAYGDLTFSTSKFPDTSRFITTLHNLGIKNVTAWVHPFINPDSSEFTPAVNKHHLLPGQSAVQGNDISLVNWWHDYGGVINYLNEETQDWQEQRLTNFMAQYDLTSLKFDAGGETYIPRCIYLQNYTGRIEYSQTYVDFVGRQTYAANAEVRVGYFSQNQPVFFRMLDKDSSWGLQNGLHSVLTTALSLGIAGYPFIMPNMIGGNGYSSPPDRELYVRWLQLNVFLPVMQFSYPPWRFDKAVIDHARDMIILHQEITQNYTIPLANDSLKTGFPIVRPLWWIAPDDNYAVRINDQFLIGNDLLVAPILEKSSDGSGNVNRLVYFPSGKWKCMSSKCMNEEHKGPHNESYTVELTEILYFKLES